MTVTLYDGERRTLHALAVNVAVGKRDAHRQRDELVPLLCDVPDALRLFDQLTLAIRCGDGKATSALLDRLAGEQ